MQFHKEIAFLVASVATALILHLFPYDGGKVALYRLEAQLRLEPTLREMVSGYCKTLEYAEESSPARYLARVYRPQISQKEEAHRCRLLVETTEAHRFFVRNQTDFLLLLQTQDGTVLHSRHYLVDFPTPLALLPVAMFLLALLFEFRPWSLGATLASYLLLLGGGNLIQTTQSALNSTVTTFTANPNFLGLLLIILWLAMHRSRKEVRPTSKAGPITVAVNRAVSALAGLWNPAFFTVGAKLFLPFRGSLDRLTSFLDTQFLILCLSLYLLSLDLSQLGNFLHDSVLLPRYFTFAGILFLGLRQWVDRGKRTSTNWAQTGLWRGLAAVIVVEAAATQWAVLQEFPTVTRLGIALVLSEVLWPGHLSLRVAARTFFPTAGVLFVATFMTLTTLNSGITDLVLVLWEPRAHPTAVALFTFLAGLCLGFLTGSFSTTFFTLYSVLIQSYDLPLVKAALIDGIVAGSLLSPFSVFNLFPMAQFGLGLHDLIRFRLHQLTAPLVIAGIIYAVCAINSVAILQPVTFVFLCLVGLATQLKKSSWRIGRHTSVPETHSVLR